MSGINGRSVQQIKPALADTGPHPSHTGDEFLTTSELLTVTEVAAKLRLPRSWVYLHADELGVYRAGKYLRFDWQIVTGRLAAGIGRDAGASRQSSSPIRPIQNNNRK